MLITNGQFRKLLKDSTVLLRDIAGDAATNVAGKVRPGEEQLSQLDRPAEDNTWHEKPDLSKDNLRKQAKAVYGGNPKDDARDVAQAGSNAAGLDRADVNRSADPTIPDGVPNPQKVDQVAGQNAAVGVAKSKLNEKIDDDTKEKIKQRNEAYRRQANAYFNKKLPQDRKDQIIFRLKKMILECQQHSDYTEAVQTILRLAENYGKHGRTYGQGSAGTVNQARTGFAAAEADLRTLIERFANGTSTSDLWESIGQIYKDAEKDPELKGFFKNLNHYVRRLLLEQGYILDESSTREWDRLYEQGRYLLRQKYRTHTDRVVDEIKFVADQFDKDVQNQAFAHAVQKLFQDLGNDDNGKPTFKPHLLKDLTDVILPAIFENVAYIPIPRIEYSDHQFDAVIENLVLESDNFMPNVLDLSSENYFRWGRKKIVNKNKNTIEIKVAGVQMDLRDVSFHFKKKQGFPSISDTGVADLLLPGDGLSFKIKVTTADKKDRENFFKVEKVDIDFKQLKLKVTKSNHKLLFSLFKPIALKAMRPALQKAVEKAIKDQFNKADKFLYEVKKEADKAQAQVKNDPANAPNIYKRYSDAFQSRLLQGKEKAKAFTEDKKVNVAMTKEDSIFPSLSLPGGISSKATEYRDLARKGEKWESPVFSIGNAKKSQDIPLAPKIERKAHTVSGQGATIGNIGNGSSFTGGALGGVSNGGVSNGGTNGALNGHGKNPIVPAASTGPLAPGHSIGSH